MAYEQPGLKVGELVANADLTASQYLFGVLTAGKVAVAGAGVDILGVINNDPNINQPVELIVNGIAKVKAGAAVAVGAKVMSNASGQAITATATNKGLGFALAAAGAANEVIPVLLKDLGTQ